MLKRSLLHKKINQNYKLPIINIEGIIDIYFQLALSIFNTKIVKIQFILHPIILIKPNFNCSYNNVEKRLSHSSLF